MANEVARQLLRATDAVEVARLRGSQLARKYGPLMRKEYEDRINRDTWRRTEQPQPNRQGPQEAPSEPLQGPITAPPSGLPPTAEDVLGGPQRAQQQLQQQQRTNVGGVGVQNRMIISGDNADEAARMRVAQDQIDSVVGSGGQWTREDALRMHNELGGVNVPPANPAPRLEVSDANFQFRQDFLDHMDAKTAELDTAGKNPWGRRPFAELFSKDAKLGDIIDDSWEVFKYYPSLRDINLKPLGIFDGLFGTKGAYDNITKTMFLPRNLGKNADELEDVRSTIIHEVQHYIQDVEGWARGGNPEEFKNLFRGKYKDFTTRRQAVQDKYKKVVERVNALPEVERFRRLADEGFGLPKKDFEKTYSYMPPSKFEHPHARTIALQALGYSKDTAVNRFLSMTYDEMASSFQKVLKHQKSMSGFIRPEGLAREVADELAQILALKKSLEKYTTVQEQIRMAGKIKKLDGIDKLGYEGYQKLFGEMEARQAQDRMNMTDAERAATPQEIMNIDPNETIVRGQNEDLKGNIVPGLSFESGHIVFHGGPISAIDRFLLDFIGTGEGGIARGWGLYFAERPGTSVGYRNARADDKKLIGGVAKKDWDWRSQVHTSLNGSADRLFYDTENAIIKDLNWDSHYDVYSQFKANFIGLLGSEFESLSRRLKGDFSKLSEFQRTDKLFKIIEEANDLTVDKLTRNVKFYRKLSKEAPSSSAQEDLAQNMAALSYAQKFKTFVEDSEDITRELKQVFEDTITRYEASPEVPNLKDDAGLFVIDLKANKDLDYIHLDEDIKSQSRKVRNIINDNFTLPVKMSFNKGEDLVNLLETVVFKNIKDVENGIGRYAIFTPKGAKAMKSAYRRVLDSATGGKAHWDNRKFASLLLEEMGIPGSAHWDAQSRGSFIPLEDKTSNFVIWNEDIIEQLAVQPHSWRDRGHLEVDPNDHPLTDEYKPK